MPVSHPCRSCTSELDNPVSVALGRCRMCRIERLVRVELRATGGALALQLFDPPSRHEPPRVDRDVREPAEETLETIMA